MGAAWENRRRKRLHGADLVRPRLGLLFVKVLCSEKTDPPIQEGQIKWRYTEPYWDKSGKYGKVPANMGHTLWISWIFQNAILNLFQKAAHNDRKSNASVSRPVEFRKK